MALALSGASGTWAQNLSVLKVAATAVPHAEILNFVKPKLKAEGVDLQVVEFSDYVQPNLAVADKQLDANFFQHKPYLDSFVKERKVDLVLVPNGGIHIEPFGAYSKKIKRLDDLKSGSRVAIPNDPTNGGRALLLLQAHGAIKLKKDAGLEATVKDIVENPKKLKFSELEAPQLPRALDDVDVALINTNYALQAGLNPTKDALVIEGKDSPYVNVLAARSDNAASDAVTKLAQALRTPEVKDFLSQKYKGAVVPAF
ncbi:MAG: MetQ/NlpA family ABC transporter substrate-binding protein [Burkholderiaceae bacterium]|nr:MetQ/NlpA family ABC transporter substrate-binding protein [Burkholderiaceae bacterium]